MIKMTATKVGMELLSKLTMVVLSKLRMVMEWPMLKWNQPLMNGDKEESQSVTVKVLVEVLILDNLQCSLVLQNKFNF